MMWIEGDIIVDIERKEYWGRGGLGLMCGVRGKGVDGKNKGRVIFVMGKVKEGEREKSRYVRVGDIWGGVRGKKGGKGSV